MNYCFLTLSVRSVIYRITLGTYLQNNNKIKASNLKTPFCYHDLLDYIKNQSNTIQIKKSETKKTYQNILIHEAKHYTNFGETIWKNKIKHLNFAKI